MVTTKKFIRFTSIVALSLATLAFCTQVKSSAAAASADDEDLNQGPSVSTSRGQEKVKSFFEEKWKEETWKVANNNQGAIIHLINQYSEDLSPLLSLPEDSLANVLEFVGTKASSNVCQTFHRLLRGTPAVRGIGHFRIKNKRNFLQENLRRFENVHSLSLANLPNVRDVSALRGVQHLELRNLPLVDNVSALGGVPHLRLRNLPLVDNVSALGRVPHLSLLDLPLVNNVSRLGGVQHLRLRSLPLVDNVSALDGVPHLSLFDLPGIANFRRI